MQVGAPVYQYLVLLLPSAMNEKGRKMLSSSLVGCTKFAWGFSFAVSDNLSCIAFDKSSARDQMKIQESPPTDTMRLQSAKNLTLVTISECPEILDLFWANKATRKDGYAISRVEIVQSQRLICT